MSIISTIEPYLIIFGSAMVMMLLSMLMDNHPTMKKYMFLIGWIAIILFVGLRDMTVGTDTDDYLQSFHHPETGYGENGSTDPGFQLYLYLTHYLFFDSGTLFLLVSCLIGLGGIGHCIWHNSKQPVMSLMAFISFSTSTVFFFHSLSAVRQSIAEGLFLMALSLYLGTTREEHRLLTLRTEGKDVTKEEEEDIMESRNRGLSILLFIIAASFHGSALAMLPIVLAAPLLKNVNRWIWSALIVGSYLISAFSPISVSDLVFMVFSVFGRGSDSYLSRYGSYSNFEQGEVTNTGILNPDLWPFALLAIIIVWRCDKVRLQSQWTILFLLSVVFNNLFSDNIIWGRLFIYLSLLSIVVVPNAIEQSKSWIYRGGFTLFAIYFIVRAVKILFAQWLVPQGNIVAPYQFTNFTI
ncbi:MAG: EpsG family protein [Bacteroidales bacterium]|nr:EpsG family protein [Bacteroidales bacterium]